MLVHKGTQPIVSDRLLLNKFEKSDTKDFFKNVTSRKEVTECLLWEYHKTPIKTISMINQYISNYKMKNYYNWCIRLKDDFKAIGAIELCFVDNETMAIGYCLCPEQWNKGIMNEALGVVINYARELNCKTIVAECFIDNKASINLLKKNGFLLREINSLKDNRKYYKFFLKL